MPHGVSQPDPGSFRDRDGRVYRRGQRVVRGLSEPALEHWRALEETEFYRRFRDSGRLVGTREIPADESGLAEDQRRAWAGFLEHHRVPVISYPYEWSFSMLQAAALLQLELTEAAINEGWTLKDATPYNVQFDVDGPVFIDIASFEPLADGAPWAGYRQFCEMFLFPLLLQAYRGLDFQPFLRSRMDGVDVQAANRLFSLRDRFRKGVLTNVWLQAKLDRRYGGSQENVRSSLKSAGFNRELILANVRKLRKLVAGLAWDGEGSEWGGYSEFHNYTDADLQQKEDFVARCAEQLRPVTAWDIGCNTGRYALRIAPHCGQVVAMDIDHLAVERLYRNPERSGKILPLVQNLADPSPEWGWRNRERGGLAGRSQPDLVLCLALIHHLVISANIPLEELVDWLAGLAPQLVIEFVSREDDKVQSLLRNKDDKYVDYDQAVLERCLAEHFEIREQQALRGGLRRVYWCSRRD